MIRCWFTGGRRVGKCLGIIKFTDKHYYLTTNAYACQGCMS